MPAGPCQGLAESQSKVLPRPHCKPRALGAGHLSAPAAHENLHEKLGSQEGGLEPGPGAKGQTQVWCCKAKASLCPCPGPVPAARTRAELALPFRPQILTWSQSPQWGPVNSNRPLLGDSGPLGSRVPWIPGLRLLEAHRGPGGSLEAGTGPPLSPTVLKHPLGAGSRKPGHPDFPQELLHPGLPGQGLSERGLGLGSSWNQLPHHWGDVRAGPGS